ncbi:MlaD family protein [Mycolicibacter kumamotonensis]|uniref:Mammalian cell entry protein n=1 Tax=Mycolicibacter kumamotonensis TaxID=354243 RepID=A0A1B8SA62_9MYCO|nr:MlaD family protein [Mycolicibacter kumamotonensis]OBY29562.1 mammalian cell entry protein [Mycolicibacter kumamotonensis]
MGRMGAMMRLALSAFGGVLLFIFMANAIQQPIATRARHYTAEFTDASGLHVDADIRIRGVRVGKVLAINLERRSGESIAAVDFTLDERYAIVSDSRLAVKFQSLTGLRYIEVNRAGEGVGNNGIARVPTEMTTPSFDITALFNGLEPVIATLSPEEINTFTNNVISYLSGDGSGLAPMVESIHKLTRLFANRQEVLTTIMQNLANVSESIGGNAPEFIQIIDWVRRPLDGALNALEEFNKSELYGDEFNETVVRLLTNIGFPPILGSAVSYRLGPQYGPKVLPNDIDLALDRAFSNLDDYTDAFKYIPVVWQDIPEPPDDGPGVLPCSQGRFNLPVPMDILLNGQKVVVCNK